MRIVSAIPIVRGVAPDVLSYYTSLSVSEGALVEVPVRKKFTPALVISVRDAKEATSDVRRAAYKLKKIKRVISPHALPRAVVAACERLSAHYAAPLGAVLYSLVPQYLFSTPSFIDILTSRAAHGASPALPPPVRTLQLPYEERLARYKSIIRESFAQKKSVVVIAPSRAHAEDLFGRLSKGAANHAYFLASSLTPKQQQSRWEAAMTHDGPTLIVGTLSAASVWRPDIAHFIVEAEASPYYKAPERPFIDGRLAVVFLAHELGIDCILGDNYLRIETIARTTARDYEEILKLQMHQPTDAAVTLIDMRDAPHARGQAPVLSPQAVEAIERSAREDERAFVYATRTGHSPLTLCRDCGTVLSCDRCDAPMVLHSKGDPEDPENRTFICHRCGRTRGAKTTCSVCGGWRLYAYGFGIEKVVESLKELKKGPPVFTLSGDTAKTHAQAMHIVENWKASERGVLVGTARALPYLRFAPPASAVLSAFDTLLMLPDIYMQERLFNLLSFMRDVTRKRLVVQTRSPDHETLKLAVAGQGAHFFKSEDERRRTFLYPPYGVQVKVTLAGAQREVIERLEELAPLFAPHDVAVYPAFVAKVKNRYIAHALVTVPAAQWPDEKVEEVLRTLPPAYKVDINPESLL